VRYHATRDAQVIDPGTMKPVPPDGETMRNAFRGNITMKGYLKNPGRHAGGAFAGALGSILGDLAVQYPDGYIKIKDRSKDASSHFGRRTSVDRGRRRAHFAILTAVSLPWSCCRMSWG
jgi:acyl-CoA synthetase (AMP-forming)/AMP-acid ligase II